MYTKAQVDELIEELRSTIPMMEVYQPDFPVYDETYKGVYIGSYMSLDPCGCYHCVIVPNDPTDECQDYWEALDRAAESLGGWIESGEDDPTDIYFCMPNSAE